MSKKKKITHICKFCGESADLIVLTDDDGYSIIKCNSCNQVVTEGFGDPDELLDDYVEYENYE